MKLVRISVICSLTGVCLRLQAMPNMQRSLRTALYNSVLSGISLDGLKYFYTNPLRISADLPYHLTLA